MQDMILILGQDPALMGLIARTLRRQQVYCKLLPLDTPACEVHDLKPKGVILAAGQEAGQDTALPEEGLFAPDTPVLALGSLTAKLCVHFGGAVSECLPSTHAVTFGSSQSPLFTDIAGGARMLYGLECLDLPEVLVPIATATEQCIGFQHQELPLYAMQYPIEHNDPDAAQLLYNFACLICGAQASWDEDSMIEEAVGLIRETAGEGRVLCAVSGGVDSAVCAKLAHMAVGDRLHCVLIDTGFFRKEEPEEILRDYQEQMKIPVERVDARKSFMQAMAGVYGRKEKELTAGALLSRIFQEQRQTSDDIRTVVLGTNFEDILYEAEANFAAEPAADNEEGYRVLAPLIGMFKEEVRRLASVLSLPASLAGRQSFPSGGLALRIWGEVTQEKLAVLREADALFQEEVLAGGHEKRLWQYFASLMEPSGKGGSGYIISLRALQSAQVGAYAARLPYDLLERVTQRILAEIPGVNRVIYDLTPGMRDSEQE